MAKANVIVIPHKVMEGAGTDTTIIEMPKDLLGLPIIVAIGEMVETLEQDLKDALKIPDLRWENTNIWATSGPYAEHAIFLVEQNGNPMWLVEGIARVAPFMTKKVWSDILARYPSL